MVCLIINKTKRSDKNMEHISKEQERVYTLYPGANKNIAAILGQENDGSNGTIAKNLKYLTGANWHCPTNPQIDFQVFNPAKKESVSLNNTNQTHYEKQNQELTGILNKAYDAMGTFFDDCMKKYFDDNSFSRLESLMTEYLTKLRIEEIATKKNQKLIVNEADRIFTNLSKLYTNNEVLKKGYSQFKAKYVRLL
jgi:transcription termination factor NusB